MISNKFKKCFSSSFSHPRKSSLRKFLKKSLFDSGTKISVLLNISEISKDFILDRRKEKFDFNSISSKISNKFKNSFAKPSPVKVSSSIFKFWKTAVPKLVALKGGGW